MHLLISIVSLNDCGKPFTVETEVAAWKSPSFFGFLIITKLNNKFFQLKVRSKIKTQTSRCQNIIKFKTSFFN